MRIGWYILTIRIQVKTNYCFEFEVMKQIKDEDYLEWALIMSKIMTTITSKFSLFCVVVLQTISSLSQERGLSD